MNLIFDIGANIGCFSKKCFEVYPNCKIIAVEPNESLVKKINENNLNKNIVILTDIASTKSDETIEFYISNSDTISTASRDWVENSRFSNNYKWNNSIKKKTINIDGLIRKFGSPDLIKIDVEGYELEVIRGLSSKSGEICFEWAEEQYVNINKSCKHLKDIGYKKFGVVYEDEYLARPNEYSLWENCKIHKDISVLRKEKWGMIWAK